MATQLVRFRLRNDTSSNWTTNNPVLATGEPGYETDTNKVKFGDGTTSWRNLSYTAKPDFVSVKDYGAIGDGNSHPLSDIYSSVASAQAVYPFVTSLTQELDWAATTKAITNSSNIFFPAGTYQLGSSFINLTNVSNKRFYGVGALSKITASGQINPIQFNDNGVSSNITFTDLTLATDADSSTDTTMFISTAAASGTVTLNNTDTGYAYTVLTATAATITTAGDALTVSATGRFYVGQPLSIAAGITGLSTGIYYIVNIVSVE
jgi:hypothetical protein